MISRHNLSLPNCYPKGNQSWIFIGRTDAEAEAPVLWPPDAKSRLIRKDPDAEKDWRQEDKGMTEDEMGGWHHRLNGREFEKAPGDGEGQGSLACFWLWGHQVWKSHIMVSYWGDLPSSAFSEAMLVAYNQLWWKY